MVQRGKPTQISLNPMYLVPWLILLETGIKHLHANELAPLEELRLWHTTIVHAKLFEFAYASRFHVHVFCTKFKPLRDQIQRKRCSSSQEPSSSASPTRPFKWPTNGLPDLPPTCIKLACCNGHDPATPVKAKSWSRTRGERVKWWAKHGYQGDNQHNPNQ
ncbi:hypothetical protein BC827DRAFT_1158360 [Russula dissimulans]|nr:hypothetical protein BC827DRAFT_1158360 [Russula dissimulans]